MTVGPDDRTPRDPQLARVTVWLLIGMLLGVFWREIGELIARLVR